MKKSLTIFCLLLGAILSSAAAVQAEETVDGQEGPPASAWADRISVSGAVTAEYRWISRRDVSTRGSDSTSDLYLRAVELSLGADIADWMTSAVTVNSEWIGDDLNSGDERLTVDEAVIELQKRNSPLYLVAGKRTQPFGLFENPLVTDPMTQDAYETKKAGLTIGYRRPTMDLDASLTLYKGEEMMAHLFESGLFDSGSISRVSDTAGDDVSSYILSISLAPAAGRLSLGAAYLSEPGNGGGNSSLSLSAGYDGLFIEGLSVDTEYITALEREKYQDASSAPLAGSYKESVLSLCAAYRPSPPLEVALRYEHFDDDGLADATGTFSTEDRYSIGGTYTFYEDDASGVASRVSVEYRGTGYRLSAPLKGSMDDGNSELYLRLGVEF